MIIYYFGVIDISPYILIMKAFFERKYIMFNFNYDPIIPVSPTIPYAYKPSTIATALKKEMFSDNIISNLIRNSMLKKEESDLKNVNLCLTSLSDIITSKQHYEINIKISKSYVETNYKINSASPDLLILIANICEAEFKNDKSVPYIDNCKISKNGFGFDFKFTNNYYFPRGGEVVVSVSITNK